MTHPIHKYAAIAKQWDAILADNDGGKLRRPITAEECCRMVSVLLGEMTATEMTGVEYHLRSIRRYLAASRNGVNSEDPGKE